jgi:methyl-accepting chemotaxis protein
MRGFRNLRIAYQLALLTAVMLVILAASVFVGLQSLGGSMLADRQQRVTQLIQVATKIVDTWYARERTGELTREAAQKAALDQLRDIRFGVAEDYFFVQRYDGVTLLNPNRQLEGKNRLDVKDSSGTPYVRDQIDAAKNGGGLVTYRFPRPDTTTPLPKLSYSLGFAPWEWAICTGIYIDDIDVAWNAMALRFAGFGVVALAILLGVSLTIGRAVAIPLRRLTGTLDKLSNGDLEVEIPYTDLRNEIGAVAGTVDAFREGLRRDSERAKTRALEADELELKHARIETLTRQFGLEMDGITHSLAAASAQMRSNAEQLSQNAEIAQNRAASVREAAGEAASNVVAVSASVKVMSVCVSEIGGAMTETSRISREAVSGATAARASMQELVEAASKIGEIVGIVDGIASQTNLLALNATIEAARAGEAGKGFAVVAHEVKNLAGKTSEATAQIGAQVTSIQERTATAMAAINGVVSTIQAIDQRTIGISAQVEEQEAGTQEIGLALSNAANGTDHVRGSIADVATGASETRTNAAELLSAADGLSRQSNDLGGTVTGFLNALKAA